MTQQNPFVRNATVDKPGIMGARWWSDAIREVAQTGGRRSALGAMIGISALMAVGGIVLAGASASDSSGTDREEQHKTLELQKDYGWSFGAVTETVVFEQQYTTKYSREALKTLVDDLAPEAAYAPLHTPTLLQSPEAMPRLSVPEMSTSSVRPIAEALRPILTPKMEQSFAVGKSLAAKMQLATPKLAMLVDLEGAESVAFAAGVSSHFAPVLLFENWPHPRGVVPSHRALAAAVYYQPLFKRNRANRKSAMPVFVADRERSQTYVDDANKFDNRYWVKLPPAAALKALGVMQVLYVIRTTGLLAPGADIEESLAEFQRSGIEVKAVNIEAFKPSSKPAAEAGDYEFGGDPSGTDEFASGYFGGGDSSSFRSGGNLHASRYKPSKPAVSPAAVGITTVAIAAGTGYVMRRSGSWNRSSGGWGG